MIRPFGEQALLVELEGWAAAGALAASLDADPIRGVEAIVPGLASVLVELEPSTLDDRAEIVSAIEARLEQRPAAPRIGRRRTIPIVYGGEHGPDLQATAEILGTSPDELVARHAAAEVRVLFCGFAPGFAYLGELPAELSAPRLATPRTRTPAGSVGIAGSMTGIYPADLPGGWRVIGRTPLLLFDPHRDPPSYLGPGDTVRWRPVGAGEWPDAPEAADDW